MNCNAKVRNFSRKSVTNIRWLISIHICVGKTLRDLHKAIYYRLYHFNLLFGIYCEYTMSVIFLKFNANYPPMEEFWDSYQRKNI